MNASRTHIIRPAESNEGWFGDDGNLTMSRYGRINGTQGTASGEQPPRGAFSRFRSLSYIHSPFHLRRSDAYVSSGRQTDWHYIGTKHEDKTLPVKNGSSPKTFCFLTSKLYLYWKQSDFTANHKSVWNCARTSLENFRKYFCIVVWTWSHHMPLDIVFMRDGEQVCVCVCGFHSFVCTSSSRWRGWWFRAIDSHKVRCLITNTNLC